MKINWQTKKLGEICDVLDSKRKPVTQKDRTTGKYPYYGATGIVDYVDKYIFDEKLVLIGEDGAKWKSGDNTAFIVNGKYWVNNHAHVIRPNRDIVLDEWIVYFINLSDLSEYITGVTVPKLNQAKMRDIEIPIPPLSEQKGIINILDDFFEKLEKAKQNVEKNLSNSKELFEYYLRDTFSNKKKGWEVKKLGEVAEYFNGLTYSPKDVSDEGVIVLRSSNVQKDKLDFSDIVRVSCSIKEKVMVQEGDILMCSRNGSKRLVGKTATIKNLKEGMTFGTFMMIIRGKNNPYLEWFFKSVEFRKQISGGENTMINQITRYMLDEVVIAFPPQKEQKAIIKKLDILSSQTKKLESLYQKKLENLDELKKSILRKAFNGEL